jgi:uncharacterized MAPEG superfamily protein
MTAEYQLLLWSVILGLVLAAIAATGAIMVRGLPWALGPRDEVMPPLPKIPGRLDRAFYNFMETFPLFAALVLAAGAMGVHNSLTVWGATLYFWARVIHLPLYAAGIPVVRTLVWSVSMVGIVMIACALF